MSWLEWRHVRAEALPPDMSRSLAADLLLVLRDWLAAKRPAAAAASSVPAMHLGEENRFYWNKELGGYVERGLEEEYRARLQKRAPPPPATAVTTKSPIPSGPTRRGRKYVDATGKPVTFPTGAVAAPPLPLPPPPPVLVVVTPSPKPVFKLSDPIDIRTYDWEAALAAFEETVKEYSVY